jgi:hypothetical protein
MPQVATSTNGYLHDDGTGVRVWQAVIASDVTSALGYTPVNASLVGAVSGLATLDSTGHLTAAQIPISLVGGMDYQGTWNATTNTPALASGVGTKGYYYKVNVAGTTTLDGVSAWNVGDLAVFDGTAWDKIDGLASEVTSVAGRVGAVVLAVADVSGAAPLLSPTLSGTPTAPTPATADNSTTIATTAYIQNQSYLTTTAAAGAYAPLGGLGATGTWGIGITGNAATATTAAACSGNAATATSAGLLTGTTQTTAITWSAAQNVSYVTGSIAGVRFGTGNATTTSWQIAPNVVVSAIFRLDWQGTVALSSAIRYNYALQSQTLATSPWAAWGCSPTNATGAGPDSIAGSACTLAVYASDQNEVLTQTVTGLASARYTLSAWIRGIGSCLSGTLGILQSGAMVAGTATVLSGLGSFSTLTDSATLEVGVGNGTQTSWNLSGITPTNFYITDWQAVSLLSSSSRTNLLYPSSNFSSVWTLDSGVLSMVYGSAGPSGANDGNLLTENSVNGGHSFARNLSGLANNTVYTVSAYVKPNGRTKFDILAGASDGTGDTLFDLSLVSVVSGSGTITALSDGWFFCTAQFTSSASGGIQVLNRLWNGSTPTYVGDGVSGMYFSDIQCELGSTAGRYIPTSAAAISVTDYVWSSPVLALGVPMATGAVLSYAGSPSSNYTFVTGQFGVGNNVNTVWNSYLPPNATQFGVYKKDWQLNQNQYASSRTNIFPYSESVAAWTTQHNVLSYNDIGVAPNGAYTLGKVIQDTTTNLHYVESTAITIANGSTYTLSMWLKATGTQYIVVQGDIAHSYLGGAVGFDLTNGLVNQVGSGVTASIIPYGSGLYRIIMTATASGTTANVGIYLSNQTGNVTHSFAGDGVSGIYIWGAQLELGSAATSYIPNLSSSTSSVTDYSVGGGNITFGAITNAIALASLGTGNGSTTAFAMAAPPTGTATATAVWRSDWQGNLLMYSISRTNILLQSNTFANASWSKSFGGAGTVPVVTGSYSTGPDGTAGSASRLQCSLNGGTTTSDYSYIAQAITFAASNYSISVWVKTNDSSTREITFSAAGISTPLNFSVNGTWQRITTLYAATAGSHSVHIGLTGGQTPIANDNAVDLSIAFSQAETGVSPTSVIVTTTSAASVTDYTQSSGTVTFATAPLSGAALTYTGSYQGGPATGSVLTYQGSILQAGAVEVSGLSTSAWTRVAFTTTSPISGSATVCFWPDVPTAQTQGDTLDLTKVMLEPSTTAGGEIVTTTTAGSLTDYTLSPGNVCTITPTPVTGAILTLNGTGSAGNLWQLSPLAWAIVAGAPITLWSCTVAQLPLGTNGQTIYVSNACKPGESTGSGTGVKALYTNGSWRRTCDYAAVSA